MNYGVFSDPEFNATMPHNGSYITDPHFFDHAMREQYFARWRQWAAIYPDEKRWPEFVKRLMKAGKGCSSEPKTPEPAPLPPAEPAGSERNCSSELLPLDENYSKWLQQQEQLLEQEQESYG